MWRERVQKCSVHPTVTTPRLVALTCLTVPLFGYVVFMEIFSFKLNKVIFIKQQIDHTKLLIAIFRNDGKCFRRKGLSLVKQIEIKTCLRLSPRGISQRLGVILKICRQENLIFLHKSDRPCMV